MRVLPCLILCILSILLTPTFAILESYVVYMGAHSHDHDITNFDLLQVQESHYDFLGSFIGRDKAKEAIFYSYTRHINGFAAVLDVDQAAIIAGHPKVVSMFLNQGRKLHTTRSWTFLGVEKVNGEVPPPSIWNHARFGEHTIIANFDTGNKLKRSQHKIGRTYNRES